MASSLFCALFLDYNVTYMCSQFFVFPSTMFFSPLFFSLNIYFDLSSGSLNIAFSVTSMLLDTIEFLISDIVFFGSRKPFFFFMDFKSL